MTPQPPFHTVTDELLYNLYTLLKGGEGNLNADDINSLAKLNAIIKDADLLSSSDVLNLVNGLRGNVPEVANSLEKILNIIQGLTYLKREEIDTIAELNAIISDTNLVRIDDLAEAIISLNLKQRTIQFYFTDHWDDDHEHSNDRNLYLLQGKINSLTEDLTFRLSGATYKTRLDNINSWVFHANLIALQSWVDSAIGGSELTGTKFWVKCYPVFKQGMEGDAGNLFSYRVA